MVLPVPASVHEARFCGSRLVSKLQLRRLSLALGKVTSTVRATHPVLKPGSSAVFYFPCDDHVASERLFAHGLELFAADPVMAVLAARECGFESHAASLGTHEGGPLERAPPGTRNADGTHGLDRLAPPSASTFLSNAGTLVKDLRRKVGDGAERALLGSRKRTTEASGGEVARLLAAASTAAGLDDGDAAKASAVLLQASTAGILAADGEALWEGLLPGALVRMALARFRTALPQASDGHLRRLLGLFKRLDANARGRVSAIDFDLLLCSTSDSAADSVALRFILGLHPRPQLRGTLNPFEFVSLVDAICVLNEGELIVGFWEWLNRHTRQCGVLSLLSSKDARAANTTRDEAAARAKQHVRNKRLAALGRAMEAAAATAEESESRAADDAPDDARQGKQKATGPPVRRRVKEASSSVIGRARVAPEAEADRLLPDPDTELMLDPWDVLQRHPELVEAAKSTVPHPDRALVLQIVRLAAAGGDPLQPLVPISFTDFSSILDLTDQAFYPLKVIRNWLRHETGGSHVWDARRAARLAHRVGRQESSRELPVVDAGEPVVGDAPAAPLSPPRGGVEDWRAEFGLPDLAGLLREEVSSRPGSRASVARPASHGAWSLREARTAATGISRRDKEFEQDKRPGRPPPGAHRRHIHAAAADEEARRQAHASGHEGVVRVVVPALAGPRRAQTASTALAGRGLPGTGTGGGSATGTSTATGAFSGTRPAGRAPPRRPQAATVVRRRTRRPGEDGGVARLALQVEDRY